jgi:hypothetical protein
MGLVFSFSFSFVGFVSSGLLRSWNHKLELIAKSLDAAGGT